MHIEAGERTLQKSRHGPVTLAVLVSQEIVRCLTGYIIDLHVILDGITIKTAICNVTDNDALDVMNEHVRSGRRDGIHRDIRNFVTDTYPTRFANLQKDLVLEKIIDLIRQYCDLPSGYTVDH